MAVDAFADFRGLEFVQSRVPPLDALSIFVPEGGTLPPDIDRVLREHPGRWYPVEGGHRVLVLYEGWPYDHDAFKVERGAWDHDHCSACRRNIPSMTLCWVTPTGKYMALCTACKTGMDADDTRGGRTRG
jgi:hypothetical protein